MNEIVNTFLLVDDKFMPKIHLKYIREGVKRPYTSFSSVTPTNVGIRSFSFNLFCHTSVKYEVST